MLSKIRKFLKNEKGATMIEYALLTALISIAAIATLTLLGPAVNDAFVKVNTEMGKAGGP